MKNITVDWRVFEYKFSANPQSAFESLSYTLFCHEFNQKQGIFRYFNQPYIETMPVDTQDDFITGFQAKYYEPATSLSSKKSDLIAAIKGANEKYPQLNRLIIYTNKDMSVSNKKGKTKPKYQAEIEKSGSDLGITIEWRLKSNFEIMLNSVDLSVAKELYFDPNSELQMFFKDISNHSSAILERIKSDIKFKEQKIKISYNHEPYFDSKKKVFVIYGNAGTGKSGFVKDIIEDEKLKIERSNILVFSASDFDVEDEAVIFKNYGNYRLDDLFSIYKDEKDKICIIDSAEKYCIFKRPDIFKSIIKKYIDNNWRVIFTIRTVYREGFCNVLLEGTPYDSLCIDNITESGLSSLSKKFGFELPQFEKSRALLCNLFNLKLYLNLIGSGANLSITAESFMDSVWDIVIRNNHESYNNLPARRERFVKDMAFDLINKDTYMYSLKPDDETNLIISLENSNIISPCNESRDLWMFSHDIYEEIICNHLFSEMYVKFDNAIKFFEDWNVSFYSRKMYRIWLETKLIDTDNNIFNFLSEVLNCHNLEQAWKDETVIALMNCDNRNAIKIMESMFSLNSYELFTRAVFLLNTACRTLNAETYKLLANDQINNYRITSPTGKAWEIIFTYICNNKDLIPWTQKNIGVVTEALKSWVMSTPNGYATRCAGLIALFLKHKIWVEEEHYLFQGVYSDINDVILKSAFEIKDELSEIFESVIESKDFNHHAENNLLVEKALSNTYDCGTAYNCIPQTIIRLAKAFWTNQEDTMYYSGVDVDYYFGLNPHLFNKYYPSSAYQTPVFRLLQSSPKTCLNFIIDLMNYCADSYKKSSLNEDDNECQEVSIRISKNETVRQICSDRLWKMHRGSHVAPHLLESILMALESWMLEYVKIVSDEDAVSLCLHLLRNSNNVAITSLVLSVVMSQPQKLFDISCILIHTKEVFVRDISRQQAEIELQYAIGYSETKKLFYNERAESLQLPFRNNSFENVILNYQLKTGDISEEDFSKKCSILYSNINEAMCGIDTWEPCFQFPYYRIDVRKLKIAEEPVLKGNDLFITYKADLPENLEKTRIENEKIHNSLYKNIELYLWAVNRYKRFKGKYENYSQYEGHPSAVYDEVKHILESLENKEDISDFMSSEALMYSCAVLLRDFQDCLDKVQDQFCKNVILRLGSEFVSNPSSVTSLNLVAVIISETARMTQFCEFESEWNNPWFVLLALTVAYCQNFQNFVDISELLWSNKIDLAKHFIHSFVQIFPKCANINIFSFFEANKSEILTAFSNDVDIIENINTDNLDYNSLLFLHLILNNRSENTIKFVIQNGQKIWSTLFKTGRSDSDFFINYKIENSYIKWLANFSLNLSKDNQIKLVQAIMLAAKPSNKFSNWLCDLIISEDNQPRYNSFWHLWGLMQEYIISWYDSKATEYISKSYDVHWGNHFDEVLMDYLLAFPYWSKGVEEWTSLRQENNFFYYIMSNRLGYNPTTLYSIAKVLNSVGKKVFINDGIDWISNIIKNNPHLYEKSLPTNTIYYIEEYMFWFAKKENFTLKSSSADVKKKALIILDFLVSKGSTVGFLLREAII